MSRRHRIAAFVSALVALGTLTACAGDYPMEAAPAANDPACADVTVRLPKTVADLDRRTTNAQSTGAWGDPASVLLYCGTIPTGPTTLDCVSVNGVDWIIDDARAPLYSFEAYGRSPGLRVVIDSEVVSGTEVVLALNPVAQLLPQERKCTALVDSFDL